MLANASGDNAVYTDLENPLASTPALPSRRELASGTPCWEGALCSRCSFLPNVVFLSLSCYFSFPLSFLREKEQGWTHTQKHLFVVPLSWAFIGFSRYF